eukprot:500797-Pyramimonas_sp.AAC.1
MNNVIHKTVHIYPIVPVSGATTIVNNTACNTLKGTLATLVRPLPGERDPLLRVTSPVKTSSCSATWVGGFVGRNITIQVVHWAPPGWAPPILRLQLRTDNPVQLRSRLN